VLMMPNARSKNDMQNFPRKKGWRLMQKTGWLST
jgi:hypothetical protein